MIVFCCFADNEEEEMQREDLGVSSESVPTGHEVSQLVAAALDVPVAGNAFQETPLDVRKVMKLAGRTDSFVEGQIHLCTHRANSTRNCPGLRLCPVSAEHPKAGDQVSNAKQPKSLAPHARLAFLTTKNCSRSE